MKNKKIIRNSILILALMSALPAQAWSFSSWLGAKDNQKSLLFMIGAACVAAYHFCWKPKIAADRLFVSSHAPAREPVPVLSMPKSCEQCAWLRQENERLKKELNELEFIAREALNVRLEEGQERDKAFDRSMEAASLQIASLQQQQADLAARVASKKT